MTQSYKNQGTLYDDKNFSDYKSHRFEKIIPFIPDSKVKILDVGCGECQFFDELKKVKKFEAHGIDLSPIQIKKAQKKGYHAKVHDLSKKFPYPANTFDVVVATEIIEHLYDTDFFLSEIRRILKPKGRLILTTPNTASLGDRFRLISGKLPSSLEFHSREGTSGHVRAFTINDIRDLFKYNKLNIIKLTGREFYLPLIKYGSKLDFINKGLSNAFPNLSAGFIVIAKK